MTSKQTTFWAACAALAAMTLGFIFWEIVLRRLSRRLSFKVLKSAWVSGPLLAFNACDMAFSS